MVLYFEFLFYVTALMAMSCNFVDSGFVACFELSNLCFLFVFLLIQDGNIFLLSAWQDLELTWRQDFRHTCERLFRLEEPNGRVVLSFIAARTFKILDVT